MPELTHLSNGLSVKVGGMLLSVWRTARTGTIRCTAAPSPFCARETVSCPWRVWGGHRGSLVPSSSDTRVTAISFWRLFSHCSECFLFVSEQRCPFACVMTLISHIIFSKTLHRGDENHPELSSRGSACTHWQHTDTQPRHGHTWRKCLHPSPSVSPCIYLGWQWLLRWLEDAYQSSSGPHRRGQWRGLRDGCYWFLINPSRGFPRIHKHIGIYSPFLYK